MDPGGDPELIKQKLKAHNVIIKYLNLVKLLFQIFVLNIFTDIFSSLMHILIIFLLQIYLKKKQVCFKISIFIFFSFDLLFTI